MGILFSSVIISKRSSAEAMNEASTSTVVVLTGLSYITAFGADADEDAPEPTVGTGAGAGVPVLDGSAEAALEET